MTQSKIENRKSKMTGGFTVVELLVVIGILVVLAGLISAMALRGHRSAERARMESDLQGIATALEAYKQDFGDYPRLPNSETFAYPNPGAGLADPNFKSGAELLCWALVAPYSDAGGSGFSPSDGASGPGFRVRGTRGLVYGPYLNIDTYKFGTSTQLPRYQYLKDYSGQPILYYAARNPRPDAAAFAGDGKNYLYDFRDNGVSFYRDPMLGDGAVARARFRTVLGDLDDNGGLNGAEQPVNQGPYVLWSAGPDEDFGPEDPTVQNEVKGCDDILVPMQ